MTSKYWEGRGFPWEYDPGPPKNRRWARLFAETPNYRQLSKQLLGREEFRWHFGPMFYRGRLQDGRVRVLVIGQEGAQDESLAHRSFTGGTGARMQHFLHHLGITYSYLFVNTFVYPIFGQYDERLRWLAQDPASPIVQHRHEIFNYVLERNDVHLIVAVGRAAKETVVTWVESRGGNCPVGADDVSRCSGDAPGMPGHLDPHTRIVGVLHPGGAGQGGSITAIKASFQRALDQIRDWKEDDPDWLPPDEDGSPQLDQPYKYKSAPIPFRDFPYGFPLRLGRGGTSSNRKDRQRSIQIFSAGGRYNAQGARLQYEDLAHGDAKGYEAPPGDLPYEPPKDDYRDYDKGPGKSLARLFMGGEPGLEWPDWNDLGATAHPSLGWGPVYRGRPLAASVLVLADQQSHDDMFTGRALTGESGQRLQAFLLTMGIVEAYCILRVLPVDTLDLEPGEAAAISEHPQVERVYQAIVDRILAESDDLAHGAGLVLAFGPRSRVLAQNLTLNGLPLVRLKAWKEHDSLQDWQAKLEEIRQIDYRREIADPTFAYDGQQRQIPRSDLPYGTLRWAGTSRDRARRPTDLDSGELSPDYYKIFLPDWVYRLQPVPLSDEEVEAISHAPA